MHSSVLRRATLALALAGSAALTACGSSSVESALTPERFLAVGDGYSDIGQGPNGTRPTVNDGSNNWTQQIAADYNQTLKPANEGGYSWAQAYARVTQADTTGHNAPSITQQVTSLLNATTLGNRDVVIMSGGLSDVYAEVEAANGVITDATRAAVSQAGTEFGQQVRRLVKDGGAKYVLVTGVYNLGKSPWGLAYGDEVAAQITRLSVAFNDAVLLEINNLAENVLFRDSAVIYNILANEPDTYGIDNEDTPVCTVADAYDCTTSTLVSGANYDTYLWSDSLNLTPRINRIFGDRSFGESMGYQFQYRW